MKPSQRATLLLCLALLLAACRPAVAPPGPSPTPSVAPALSQTAIPPQVPGVNPRELVKTLADRDQFTCGKIEVNPQGYYEWRCQRHSPGVLLEISLFSRTKTELDLIDANVNQPTDASDEKAIALLSFAATLPGSAEAGEAAAPWIQKTLPEISQTGDVRSKTFAGMLFRLYGSAEARSLEIGELPPF